MRRFVAKNAVVRAANGSEAEGIGSTAGEQKEHLAVCFKQVTYEAAGLFGPEIFAVTAGVAGIGLLQRSPSLGTDASVVIAGKMARAFHGRVVRHGPHIANAYSLGGTWVASSLPSRCLRRKATVVRNW